MGFQIFVKQEVGKTIVLDVEPDDTIQKIKQKIHDSEGIVPESQKLSTYLMGKILQDRCTISDYNIHPHSTIYLSQRMKVALKIFIKTLTGKTFKLTVALSDTVQRLKEMIHKSEGIPIDHQRLIFAGQTIQNEQTIGHYNIKHESTLHLVSPSFGHAKGKSKKHDVTLSVKLVTGESISVTVNLSDTVNDVKAQITQILGIPIEQQILVHIGKQLRDSLMLSEYNIKNGDALALYLVSGPDPTVYGSTKKIKIVVRTLTDLDIAVEISANQTVKDVKIKIRNQKGIPVEQQRLIFAGQQLQDHRTLKYYNIGDGDTLHIVLRLRTHSTVLPNSAQTIPHKQLTIVVKTLMSVPYTFKVMSKDTILDLKKQFQTRENYTPEQQRLIYAGMQLKDEHTFFEYDIHNDSVIHFVARALGQRTKGWSYRYEDLWIAYDAQTSAQIEDAYCHCKDFVALDKGNFFAHSYQRRHKYLIKFDSLDKIVQKNMSTGETIEIIRTPHIKETKRYMDGMKAEHARISAEHESLKQLRKKCEGICWLWDDGNDNWTAYDDETVYQIECAYKSREKTVQLNSGTYFAQKSGVYLINFASFTQQNTQSKFERKIRRTQRLLCGAKSDDAKENNTDNICLKKAAKILLQEFPEIPSVYYDQNGDMCYCRNCHNKRGDSMIYARGEPKCNYALPVGWTRLGLTTNKGFCAMNNVWDGWHVAFHGTTKDKIVPIFKSGLMLLKPGDASIDGKKISIRSGHIKRKFQRYNDYNKKYETFDPLQVFMSPSIKYASHGAYSRWFECVDPDDRHKRLQIQIAFQIRIRPSSYGIGKLTVEQEKESMVFDEHFGNHELEWYTKDSMGIVVHGILLNIKEIKQK